MNYYDIHLVFHNHNNHKKTTISTLGLKPKHNGYEHTNNHDKHFSLQLAHATVHNHKHSQTNGTLQLTSQPANNYFTASETTGEATTHTNHFHTNGREQQPSPRQQSHNQHFHDNNNKNQPNLQQSLIHKTKLQQTNYHNQNLHLRHVRQKDFQLHQHQLRQNDNFTT